MHKLLFATFCLNILLDDWAINFSRWCSRPVNCWQLHTQPHSQSSMSHERWMFTFPFVCSARNSSHFFRRMFSVRTARQTCLFNCLMDFRCLLAFGQLKKHKHLYTKWMEDTTTLQSNSSKKTLLYFFSRNAFHHSDKMASNFMRLR